MSSAVRERTPTTSDDVVAFHDSLASMCRAGVPLPRAFAMLAPDLRRGPLRDAVGALVDDLEQGVPFADAYARRCTSMPPAYGALVSAGVASGDLPGALAEIARHAERRARVARTFRRALAGPLTTAAFVIVVGALLIAFVAPRTQEIAIALDTSNDTRVQVAGVVLAFLAVAAAAAFATAWYRSPLDGRAGLGSLRLRWPVLGRIRLYAGLSGVLTTLAALVRRGVPLPAALDLTAQTSDEPGMRRDLLAMAAAAHDGAGLEDAARHAGLLPPSELWLLRAAQERGAPEEGLEDLASHYTDRLDRAVARAAATLAPAAEMAIGAVVFVLAYTFLVPITQLSTKILSLL